MNPTPLNKQLANAFESKVESGFILRLVLILYLILGLSLINFYQFKLFPDSVSYLSIALKYKAFNFSSAINGYWSPLFSWLLVPFLHFGLSPTISVKLLYLIIGLLTIIGIERLSYRFNLSRTQRGAILLALIPLVLYFSLILITPDFLLVCLFVWYFEIVFDKDYFSRKSAGILCGFWGGLGYLCKSFAFPFFLIHFLSLNLFHFIKLSQKKDKKQVVYHLLSGLFTFLIISGIWISLISVKEKKITIGSAAKYNLALSSRGAAEVSRGDKGLLTPPDKTAASAWEDPGAYSIPSWNLPKTWEFINKIIRIRISWSLFRLTNLLLMFSFFSIPIICLYFAFCFPIPLSNLRFEFLFPLFTLVLYSAGYSVFWVEERHFWIFPVLLILMGGSLISHLFKIYNITSRKTLVTFFFLLSFIPVPLYTLAKGFDQGKDIYILSQKLKSEYKIDGKIASYGRFKLPLYLSFYLGCPYYGKSMNKATPEQIKRELIYNDIDYYFVWKDSNRDPNKFSLALHNQQEITKGELKDLEIYSIHYD